MELRIVWSESSERQLSNIYEFYSEIANSRIAKKLVNKIVKRVDILINNPFAGSKEELLAKYPNGYRYLVESNYKIIYWVEIETIIIAAVFDCRQNPYKINQIG